MADTEDKKGEITLAKGEFLLELKNGDKLVFRSKDDQTINNTGFLMEMMNIEGLADGSKLGNIFELFPYLVKKVVMKGGLEALPNMDYLRKLEPISGTEVMNKISEYFKDFFTGRGAI
tara:strand:+ start:321 stop:674 length:354 start_codon:yes stop_codon:yes gene_type:complete